jgi:Peptidase M50B-like
VTAEVAAALTLPVLAGAAVAVLFVLAVATDAVDALDTIAHEGGHMIVGLLTGRRLQDFELEAAGGGVTHFDPSPWGPARIISAMAGYTMPPLLGLGGAALLAAGLAWPLLWIAVILLVLAWIKAATDLTMLVLLLLAVAIGYVALYGGPTLQAAFAAGLVWVLLFSGLRSAVLLPMKNDGSDAAALARDTLIPRQVWKAAFVAFALYCLWKGFQLLAP